MLADWDAATVTAWSLAVAGIIGTIGGAVVALRYKWKSQSNVLKKQELELQKQEAEARSEDDSRKLNLSREAWKAQNDEVTAAAAATRTVREQEAEALRGIIDDLREEIKELRSGQRRIQDTVTNRLLAADRALGECERKHAVTETELKHTRDALTETRAELSANTAYTKTLEDRIRVLEQGRG